MLLSLDVDIYTLKILGVFEHDAGNEIQVVPEILPCCIKVFYVNHVLEFLHRERLRGFDLVLAIRLEPKN